MTCRRTLSRADKQIRAAPANGFELSGPPQLPPHRILVFHPTETHQAERLLLDRQIRAPFSEGALSLVVKDGGAAERSFAVGRRSPGLTAKNIGQESPLTENPLSYSGSSITISTIISSSLSFQTPVQFISSTISAGLEFSEYSTTLMRCLPLYNALT